jgi:ubiquinone/menaquinone biosynthesis C-methylase UbiE
MMLMPEQTLGNAVNSFKSICRVTKMPLDPASTLVCPKCKGTLHAQESSLLCRHCNQTFPVIDGIPQFIAQEIFWFEPGITEPVMTQIIADLSTHNWHQLLSEHPVAAVREHYHFISDLTRADWHTVLKLNPNSVVLDFGAGTGTISQALSKHFKQVFALEPVSLRCQFMQRRFAQEGIDNITIVRANSLHLPFPDNYFDHIVLNGVLEWVPYSYREMNPRKAQTLVLKDLRRLLKPGGSISVGIENRFGIGFFLGNADCHNGVRFVTILPRLIAHAICKIAIHDIYRPYLYSSRGLRRLLNGAGFSSVIVYSSLPDYNEPRYTLPLDQPSEKYGVYIWPTRHPVSLALKRLLDAWDLLKYFGYAFRVTAVKDQHVSG